MKTKQDLAEVDIYRRVVATIDDELKSGVHRPPFAGPDSVETKCHMLETELNAFTGSRQLVTYSGLSWLKDIVRTHDGIEVTTHRLQCTTCKTIVSYDSARLAVEP